MDYKATLADKILARQAKVAIVGLGYVGLPLARLFLDQGFSVLGLDVDPDKVEALKKGHTYIKHVSAAPFQQSYEAGAFAPTSNFIKFEYRNPKSETNIKFEFTNYQNN
jgi:UDP-N-acetyl-D-glucosamine dehydrogenase